MHFEKGNIYHIYNQGNNRQEIFFKHENYLFFLKKIQTHILPYADILAWCLMPNHFHLMVVVNEVEVTVEGIHGVTLSHPVNSIPSHPVNSIPSHPVNSIPSHPVNSIPSHPVNNKMRSLNESIAIMIRSYTRAIHKQNGTSGALFREGTKAECLNCKDGVTPSFYHTNAGTLIHVDNSEKQYPLICFNYIHQNPVKAGLVSNETDWEFSSARDYAGLRNGKLVNKEICRSILITG
jgi:putative transposase